MANRQELTPLGEYDSERITMTGLLPPFVDNSAIGINSKRLSFLCNFAGIDRLVITGLSGQRTSSFMPEITGISSDGSAIANAKGAAVAVSTFESDSKRRGPNLLALRGVNGLIRINRDEILHRILDEKKWEGNSKDSNAWAYYLDSSIKGGIVDIGIKNSLTGVNHGDIKAALLLAAIIGITGYNFNDNLISAEAGISFLLQAFMRYTYGDSYRMSLLNVPFTFQLDRAFLLKFVLSRPPLIQTIPKPSG